MTYYVTALTNDRARLIVSEARLSGGNAKLDADMLAEVYEARGYIVVRREER